ncbi:hypothetical protein [Pasteurella sp. PK-2025]|uniref:hypothetical protein n=1 Tax=Pasteurella sp. PK-2025 TaxID=3413133 RepID=UPI003C75297D
MMKHKKFQEGDIFFINDISCKDEYLSFNGEHRIGKLVYLSSLFKKMIGFMPSKNTYSSIPSDLKIEFLPIVMYTVDSELKNGNWTIISHQNVTDEEILLTKRRVGNVLMLKDQEIRVCTDDDYKKYKNQGFAGLGAIHYLLRNL